MILWFGDGKPTCSICGNTITSGSYTDIGCERCVRTVCPTCRDRVKKRVGTRRENGVHTCLICHESIMTMDWLTR
jgi:ribosome-binding protein aMBF1 (putative translation factor)